MDRENTVALLKEIYQSAKTAMDAISVLIPKARSPKFRASLEKQQAQYHKVASDATVQLQGYRQLPDEVSVFSKLGMWSAVQMNTITNQNTDHMAEIMINGSTMGVIDMTKFMKNHPDVEPHAADIANRLIEIEQANIEIMKQYL
jgi:hypothetical protein